MGQLQRKGRIGNQGSEGDQGLEEVCSGDENNRSEKRL